MARSHMSTETYISNLKEYWPECPYDLRLVTYVNAQTKIKLICKEHGEFAKWTSEIRKKKLCPKCAPRKGVKKGYAQSAEHVKKRINAIEYHRGHIAHNRLTSDIFVSRINEKWPDCPYDLSLIKYNTSKEKIILKCKGHGEFEKWPSDVLNKSGCPKCSGTGFDSVEYISDLKCKLPEYDFTTSVYVDAKTAFDVICKKHNIIFSASRNALMNNKRCPECTKEMVLTNRILSGRAKDPSTLSDWELYKRKVWNETNRIYRQNKEQLGDRNKFYHLDHIYSILHGYNNNVDPLIIGCLKNLRVIPAKQNRQKNVNSDILLEELIIQYNEEIKI